ncbi:MAG: hypothetical protein GF334_10230 [Candidatus Altiarchaeales archaeon]|nr:hypothetical protein [Candidatus Altiarchaeales archaeon]
MSFQLLAHMPRKEALYPGDYLITGTNGSGWSLIYKHPMWGDQYIAECKTKREAEEEALKHALRDMN